MIKIYVLEKNGEPFYVGKTNNSIRRLNHHKKKLNDYNINLFIIDEVKEDEWGFWESHYISLYKSWGFILTNKNSGGGGPTKWTEKQKSNLERINKIKNHPTRGKNLSKALKNHSRHFTPEVREKISKGNKGLKKKPNKERGPKISKALKNHSRHYTPEVREKMKEAFKNRPKLIFTEEWLANIDKAAKRRAKPVLMYDLCGDFIKEWVSKGEAAKWIKKTIPRAAPETQNVTSQIKDCCFGRIKSCWGYIWKYKHSDKEIIPTFPPIYQFDKEKNLLNEFRTPEDLKNNLIEAEVFPKDTSLTINKLAVCALCRIKKSCENKKLNLHYNKYYSYEKTI